MSDPFGMGLEEDPASDFLARERDELAGLDDDFGGLSVENSAAAQADPVALDDDFGLGLDSAAPETAAEPMTNGIADDVTSAAVETPAVETTMMVEWREERTRQIVEKDKNEEKELAEWKETAKRELEEWQARQAEQLEKHKKNNRVAEAEFVKERDETTPGNEWERISRLCDFNPKSNKNTKDVSKLRSLLLQLKQNPVDRTTSVA